MFRVIKHYNLNPNIFYDPAHDYSPESNRFVGTYLVKGKLLREMFPLFSPSGKSLMVLLAAKQGQVKATYWWVPEDVPSDYIYYAYVLTCVRRFRRARSLLAPTEL